MILAHRFFKLTIHKQSYSKYYECEEKDKNKLINRMESEWERPYSEIPENIRMDREYHCCWRPPWSFNDIVGFVDVGMDMGVRLTGDIFLMRRYLSENSIENRYRRYDSKIKKDQMLHFRELGPHSLDLKDNLSFVTGINAIITQTEEIIRSLCKTKRYKWSLERLPIPLEHIDFVAIAPELNPKLKSL